MYIESPSHLLEIMITVNLRISQTVTDWRTELPSRVLCLWGLEREIVSAVCDRVSGVEP